MTTSIRQRFQEHYADRVRAFAAEVRHTTTTGIPEPHLPLWGKDYETAPLRAAFIGRDTRYWGSIADFLRAAQSDPQEAIFRSEEEFQQLRFTEWTNNFGTTFWDTVMQFLAVLHDIPDWRQLKRRQRDDILHTFVWAQTNAIEKWDATPSIAGADFQAWRTIKTASERHLDSFSAILNVFRPHIAIIMNWTVSDAYWDCSIHFKRSATTSRMRLWSRPGRTFSASHTLRGFAETEGQTPSTPF